ncbi:MAG: hypothetical protein HQK79_19935 [Desulfobacterales bacterium]|nr:hypothetical protein [Desulfobacterales bacterium]
MSRLLLPGDIFLCNITSSICDLQAVINLNNLDNFFQSCKATNKDQVLSDSIFESKSNPDFVDTIMGKYLCISCEDIGVLPIEKRYHYISELARLSIVGMSEQELKKILIKNHLNQAIVYTSICKQCCDFIVKIIENHTNNKLTKG